MSGALPKVGSTAQAAFAKVDAGATKAQKSFDLTNRSVNTLERALRMLERRRNIMVDSTEIDSANAKVRMLQDRIKNLKGKPTIQPTAGGSNGSGGGNIFSGLNMGRAAGIVAMLGLGSAAAGATMFSANAGLQSGAQRISFQTMAGDAQGAKLYTDLTKFAQDSIFGNELYKNAQTQLAFGGNAKDVMPTLRMLGDISMGDKERLGSLNLAYSQVQSAGKLMGQDLLQFVNAGFNPLQEISAKTGKTMNQLRADMSDGKITFDMVRASLAAATSQGGKFYKMTERIANTDYGRVEAFKGQLQGLGMQVGGAIAPAIGKMIEQYAVPLVDYVGKEIVPKVSGWVDGFMSIVDEFSPLIKNLVATGGQLIRPVVDLLKSPEIIGLSKDLLGLTNSIGESLVPAIETLTSVIRPIAAVLRPIVKMIDLAAWAVGNENNFEGAARGFETLKAEQRNSNLNKINWLNTSLNSGKAEFIDLAKQLDPRRPKAGTPYPSLVNPNMAAVAAASANSSTSTKTVSDVFDSSGKGSADAITGGGNRAININVNASPFNIEKMEVAARTGSGLDGMDDMERRFNEWFLRLLNSANAVG